MPQSREYGKNVYGEFLIAKCPCCEVLHRLRMLWIGRGVPRKFCPACKEHACPEYDDMDGTQYNARAARGPLNSIW